jgi:non-heme chloroperoxidase
MRLKYLWIFLASIFILVAAAITIAIVFGGPATPKPMGSKSTNHFNNFSRSELPALQRYAARDGESLAYRFYPSESAGTQTVVLIPGSSANSESMHQLAKPMAQAGIAVYVLDVRGHGESGRRGDIAYIGQLEDDLENFVQAIKPIGPRTLVGFSASAGFALRFAGSDRQKLFDRYLLLAPTISGNSDPVTYRFDGSSTSGGWVSVGVPRLIALTILNHFGITCFNHLDVIAYALDDSIKKYMTPTYSYALSTNFGAMENYRANILAVQQPMSIVAGKADELLYSDRYQALFEKAGRPIHVRLVPDVGHVGLILDKAGINAIISELLLPATGK